MNTVHIISLSFIKESDFSNKLEKAAKELNLNFEREETELGIFYNVTVPNYGDLIEMSSPRPNYYQKTKNLNIQGYGTLAAVDFDFGTESDTTLFPLLFKFTSYFSELVIIDDGGDWVYQESNTPIDEDGYIRIKTSEYLDGAPQNFL